MSERVELKDLEPVLHVEDEGLDIRGYEIDGEFVLDFDWAPGGPWDELNDEAKFKHFVVQWLEQMTGREMAATDIEQLKITREQGQSQGSLTTESRDNPAAKG